MDLRDPTDFASAYAEHAPAAAHAAAGVLAPAGRRGDVEDVVHDVFVRLWRDPRRFDPTRGPLGAYVRMMSRSRALDVLRSGQAAGRATERLAAAPRPLPRFDIGLSGFRFTPEARRRILEREIKARRPGRDS